MIRRESENRKWKLIVVVFDVFLISSIRDDETSVVSYIRSERVDSVHIQTNGRLDEIVILLDDAASLLVKSDLCVVAPPVNEIALRVELATLIIESVRYFC